MTSARIPDGCGWLSMNECLEAAQLPDSDRSGAVAALRVPSTALGRSVAAALSPLAGTLGGDIERVAGRDRERMCW